MLVDEDDNFVYDYWIESGKKVSFTLFNQPYTSPVELKDIQIKASGDKECSFSTENDQLIITCPKGKKIKLELIYNSDVSTEITISNPRILTKAWYSVLRCFNKSSILFNRFK